MENNKIPDETIQNKEESIFSDVDFSTQGYDKHILQARNAIFITAVALAINVAINAFRVPDSYEYMWIDFIIYGAFIAGFIFLGFWTRKKPYYAIIGALILFALFIILNALIDIKTIFSAIILKIGIVVLLIKGINDAKEAQERKEILSKE